MGKREINVYLRERRRIFRYSIFLRGISGIGGK